MGYEEDCMHCKKVIPARRWHVERECGHHFHSHCMIRAMIKYGMFNDGTTYCRHCTGMNADPPETEDSDDEVYRPNDDIEKTFV